MKLRVCAYLFVVYLANVLCDLSNSAFKTANKLNTDIGDYDAPNLDKEKSKDNINTRKKNNNISVKRFNEKKSKEVCKLTDAGKGIQSLPRQRDNYTNFIDDKIVGGYKVEITLYPYQASYGDRCGGAIIGKRWIVTTARCGKSPYVRIGSKYLKKKGRKVRVNEHFVHPLWADSNKEHQFDYDFQLLKLARRIKFEDNVQRINLARIEDIVVGTIVTVTGWGNTKEGGQSLSVLRAVRVPIVSTETCQNVRFSFFEGTLTPRMFCAGFEEGEKDSCQGDSGSPAAVDGKLLGLVSFGYGCARPHTYGVYSNLATIRNWIRTTTNLPIRP